MIRKRVVVAGEVQGVFFRDTCRREAITHQVNGWVRNLPSGSVEAVFEGPSDAVDRLVEWARHGPPTAVVDVVTVYDEETSDLSTFEIRPTPR
jgi:acylphosphatase